MSLSKKLMVERLNKLREDPRWQLIHLPVPGRPDHPEDVIAVREGEGRWRLANSPGMVPGLAAGDLICLVPEGYRLLEHGHNLCIHFWVEARDYPRAKQEAVDRVEEEGGWLDAVMGGRGFSFTLPAVLDPLRLEACFASLRAQFPGSRWQYAKSAADRPPRSAT